MPSGSSQVGCLLVAFLLRMEQLRGTRDLYSQQCSAIDVYFMSPFAGNGYWRWWGCQEKGLFNRAQVKEGGSSYRHECKVSERQGKKKKCFWCRCEVDRSTSGGATAHLFSVLGNCCTLSFGVECTVYPTFMSQQ